MELQVQKAAPEISYEDVGHITLFLHVHENITE
ncbi:MAG: hypothetical protein CM1200mP28_02740 [Deltaproteobacteria bacterium]|nr:MAG: hypothetical protein CM1200mP28_02740 [Deltaproteobacteria bacterium]